MKYYLSRTINYLHFCRYTSGNLHKSTDKMNMMPYCLSKSLNATMNVSGSLMVVKKSDLSC